MLVSMAVAAVQGLPQCMNLKALCLNEFRLVPQRGIEAVALDVVAVCICSHDYLASWLIAQCIS